jgi:type I restriction enzyme M protein
MVRDGTYLIGTTAIVTASDVPMLFQSHIYRIRVVKPADLDPWLLLACLNAPIVRRQIRAKQFTQDIIDTLGKRLFEVVLPIPKDSALRKRIAEETRCVIETRVQLRNRAREIALEVEGIEPSKAAIVDENDPTE